MNNQSNFHLGGKVYPVHGSYGIACTFTHRLSPGDHEFAGLPKSLLENFRIVSITCPDIREIVSKYFMLLGRMEDAALLTNKWLGFMRFISSGYSAFSAISEGDNTGLLLEDTPSPAPGQEAQEFGVGNLISMKTILKILRLTLHFQAEKVMMAEQNNTVSILHANVFSYFTCLLRP